MSRIDPSRIASAARKFLGELTRHDGQYFDPGYDRNLGGIPVWLAAQALNVALQGRNSIFEPLPETDPNPGFRSFVGVELDAEMQCGVIRDVLPKLLYCIGYRDPEGIGPVTGMPSLAGVRMGPDQGQRELDTLARAVEHLEALVREIGPPPAPPPREDEKPAATAAGTEAPPPEENQPPAGPTLNPETPGDQDTNTRVKKELERNPDATSPAIRKVTGIPEQTIRRSSAWRNRPKVQDQQAPKSADALDHARPLTRPMLAAIDSKAADPAEIVEAREEQDDREAIEPMELLRRRYLEGADADQKARFHQLNKADQEHELTAWKLTGDRLAE